MFSKVAKRHVLVALAGVFFCVLAFPVDAYSSSTVQGYKLDKFGSWFTNPGATITVSGQIFGPSINPYIASVNAGFNAVQSSVPQGYDVYYSLCTNGYNHPASSYVNGATIDVNAPAGGYSDLHWRYVTPTLATNFTLPANSNLLQIITGSLFTEIYNGYPNVYAPEVHYITNGIYQMWYGGGGADIRDRIHYAVSSDGINWNKQGAVIDAGTNGSNANDPTVVMVGGTYYMYYSLSENDLLDAIYFSTSSDGLTWSSPAVAFRGGPYSWNYRYASRPTVMYDNGMFKIWYDTMTGTNYFDPPGQVSVGYATSSDGTNWAKYANPVISNQAAIDIKKYQGVYVMLQQLGAGGTGVATSADGLTWTNQGTLIPPDTGIPTNILGQLTPFLFIDPTTGKPKAIYLGAGVPDPNGTSGYDRNAIYVYFLHDGELGRAMNIPYNYPNMVVPVGVTVTSEYSPYNEVDMINPSGLAYNKLTTSPSGTMWLASGSMPQTATFDLGANYNLDGMHVWNYNEAGNAVRGAQQVVVAVASAVGGPFTVVQTNNFIDAPGTVSYTGDDYGLSATNVRVVQFTVNSSYGDVNVGLGKVQFHQPDPKVVVPVGVTVTSEYSPYNGVDMISPSGLTYYNQLTTSPAGTMWLGLGLPQTATFDLGTNYNLDGMHVWNYNEAGNAVRGAQQVVVAVASAVGGPFTVVQTNTFIPAPGSDWYTGEDYGLSATNVRAVQFTINSSYGYPYVGLGKIQFYSDGFWSMGTGSISVSSGQISTVFFGIMDNLYVIQRSTNLADWISISTNIAPAIGAITNIDTFSDQMPPPPYPSAAFYRLRPH